MKNLRRIIIITLTIIVGVIIVQNIIPVETRILFIKVEMPLILLLLVTSGLGFTIGLLVGGWHRK
ncbi:MAG: LapA family protein [Bacteroidales bacterium]|nr:LapA family protein [Bacteroidales bacterium]MDZ4204179.1 LapA family protein [Bacteroidales bacterium]